MNICFFSIVTYWHGIKGGMEIHGKLLAEELVRRGHNFTIISTRHPEGKELEIQNEIELHYLKNTTFGSQRGNWRAASLKKFIELDQVNNFDIICCTPAIIPKELVAIAGKKKIPVTVILEGSEVMMLLSKLKQTLSHKRGFKSLFKDFLICIYHYFFWELPIFKKCDAIIAVSDEVTRSTQKWYFVSKGKIHTVYNGVETDLFRPDQGQREHIRKVFGISNEERLLLFLSFVTKQKGLHLLIKALPIILKSNNQVKLMVAGEGNYLTEARQLVRQLGLERYVVFTGHIPREDVPHYINASDMFILPTLRQEGMPFSLLEAMACQKPVIASRIGGIPSVINDRKDGILVNPGNVNEIAEKTIYLLENSHVANEIAKNAREKAVKQFGLNKMIEETIKVFETAITNKS